MRHCWFCLLLPGLLWSGMICAEIYRWTDAQGQTHFGQRPVAGAQQVEVKPQVVERDAALDARTERFYQARRDEQAQASAKAAERQARQTRECAGWREQLATLSRGGRYYSTDAQGERVYHAEGDIEDARRQLADHVARRCG